MASLKTLIPVGFKDALKVYLSKNRCPLCKQKVLDFKPLGGRYLDGVFVHGKKYTIDQFETIEYNRYYCPKCLSTDRARLYILYFGKTRSFFLSKPRSILHIAPDGELFSNYLKNQPNVTYRSADLLRDDVDDKVDISNMPIYKDEMFDLIICSHVLEHVPDDKAAVKEMFRVLKPNGLALIMAPILLRIEETYEDFSITDPEERWKHFGQDDHVRLYSKKGFLSRLREGGFKIQELTNKDFAPGAFTNSGISEKSVLYICRKG